MEDIFEPWKLQGNGLGSSCLVFPSCPGTQSCWPEKWDCSRPFVDQLCSICASDLGSPGPCSPAWKIWRTRYFRVLYCHPDELQALHLLHSKACMSQLPTQETPERRRAGGDCGALESAHGDRGCHCAPSIPGLPEWTSPALRELRVQPQPPAPLAALVEPHAPGER